MVFKLIGGIGLFLLGMVLLTDGIKSFSGESLRRALVRFTGTPIKAFLSGALVTLMVQSSSATTLTVIGFVSAGLLTFPQAIGVVMGASLGTTGTGWIVAIFGLKISIGFYALPLVGLGAFMRLLAKGRMRSVGLALAGFGLIFIGIQTLQEGMRILSGVVDLARLPSAGFAGHLIVMAVGIVLTVLLQSSSAATATTLTALHTGAVNFEQAAALVIGAAVGTTITGVLATIGGTIPAKRTALAHVSFNLATGIIALILLPGFLSLIAWAQTHDWLEPGAMSLVAFHTIFVAMGVVLFLPFVDTFARLIEKSLPENEPTLARHLDTSLLQTPAVALEASRRALKETAAETLHTVRLILQHPDQEATRAKQSSQRAALEQIEAFFHQIPAVNEDQPLSELRVAQMHAIDHLARIQSHQALPHGFPDVLHHPRVNQAIMQTQHILAQAETGMRGVGPGDWLRRVEEEAARLANLRRRERPAIIQQTAVGTSPPGEALHLLDIMRWLDRLGYHAWRISHYLGREDYTRQPGSEADYDRDM